MLGVLLLVVGEFPLGEFFKCIVLCLILGLLPPSLTELLFSVNMWAFWKCSTRACLSLIIVASCLPCSDRGELSDFLIERARALEPETSGEVTEDPDKEPLLDSEGEVGLVLPP